jgi:hypothetical protein
MFWSSTAARRTTSCSIGCSRIRLLHWQRWREQRRHRPASADLTLLLYQGHASGASRASSPESYELPASALDLRVPLLNFRIFVDDLSAESDERLRARVMTESASSLCSRLRHARDEDLMDSLERWADSGRPWRGAERPDGAPRDRQLHCAGQPDASKERS